jgi:hypothetical protein
MCGALTISSHRSAVFSIVASCERTQARVFSAMPSRWSFSRWTSISAIWSRRRRPRTGTRCSLRMVSFAASVDGLLPFARAYSFIHRGAKSAASAPAPRSTSGPLWTRCACRDSPHRFAALLLLMPSGDVAPLAHLPRPAPGANVHDQPAAFLDDSHGHFPRNRSALRQIKRREPGSGFGICPRWCRT